MKATAEAVESGTSNKIEWVIQSSFFRFQTFSALTYRHKQSENGGNVMELMGDKTEYSDMTFDCDREDCLYNTNSRCVYHVAKTRVRVNRDCYAELLQNEIESELDTCM